MSKQTQTDERIDTGRPSGALGLGWEKLAWIILMLAAAATRLYQLGHRVMSHDESLHTFYSWKLFDHGEYVHDPMMHGPLLFHGTALMYMIFGDNDFAARMFTVILGLLLILSPLLLRRWLGPVGALATGMMLTISPTVMYYTRYLRHDIHVELFTVLMFISFIRYLDDRRGRWIVLAFSAAALAISSAEMAYINGFVLISFILVALLAERMSQRSSELAGLSMAGAGLGILVFSGLAKLGQLNARFPSLPDFSAAKAEGALVGMKDLVQAGLLFSGLMVIFGAVMMLVGRIRLAPEADPEAEEMPLEARKLSVDSGAAAKVATAIADSGETAEGSEAAADPADSAVAPAYRPPRSSTRLGDLLYGRASLGFSVLGLILLAVGWSQYGANACSGGQPSANLVMGLEACRLAAGLLAGGGVFLLYGLLGLLLAGHGERGLASAIARAPMESIVLAGALAFAFYTLLYTTFFTNTPGFNGIVRSIRYWIEQHDVVRGDQPFYYYLLFDPMYEFLPFVFATAAVWVYLQRPALRVWRGSGRDLGEGGSLASSYVVPGLIAWSLGVFWIYSWAGEKMPWLIVHLVVPQAFLAGRLIADMVEFVDWDVLRARFWPLAGVLLLTLIAAPVQFARLLYAPSGWAITLGMISLALPIWLLWRLYRRFAAATPRDATILASLVVVALVLAEWQLNLLRVMGANIKGLGPAMSGISGPGWAQGVLGLAILGLLGWGVYRFSRGLPSLQVKLLTALLLAGLLLVVNTRESLIANFVNDELATEYIVYAHATDDDNVVLDRLKALQEKVGDRDLVIGYDNEVSWPFTWYFRNSMWPGARYLGEKPSGQASLRELDVVLVGSPNYGHFEDYLARDYNAVEYDRMWWPNEGYKGFGLDRASWDRLRDILADPEQRTNILDIVLKREYRKVSTEPRSAENAKSLDDWFHHAKMKMWVRKEIDDQAGQANLDPDAPPTPTSVFEVTEPLELDVELRFERDSEGLALAQPKGIALDAEGRLYVVDHGNARIQVFEADGQPAETIGDGMFRDDNGQPSAWGVGLAPDGTVYVADTWGHRIVKFVDGKQVKQWGVFGTPPSPGEQLELMYGPRDVAVDAEGRVYVADTGNKRISIFDSEGQGIGFIGGPGLEPGEFDEPTSVAIDPRNGNIFVADLWNFRVQVFDAERNPIRNWTVDGWQSTDAAFKAYIDVSAGGLVAFTDPEKSRVWLYDDRGTPLGIMSLPNDDRGLDQPIGITFDAQGRLYVAASGTGVVTRYAAPTLEPAGPEVGEGTEAADGDAAEPADPDATADPDADAEAATGDAAGASSDPDSDPASDAAPEEADESGSDSGGGAAAPTATESGG
jgi:predicted membrane-bound mannosyltransferase/DNA-binding beta-propeller fold protein YncE